ncbi:MAG: 3-hydroxyacyl-CoA dehydrogenase NAD-binding domain-containing protein [Thermoplasmatales archaeon]
MIVGVIGFGQMGSGIAQVCVMSKMKVIGYDTQTSFALSNLEKMISSVRNLVEKGKLPAEAVDLINSNLLLAESLTEFADCDIVIEAVTEDPKVKKDVLSKVSEIVSHTGLIASNTSSISITWLASQVRHPERFVGIHFMNPVPVMKLVEVIRGLQTDDQTFERAQSFVKALNKQPVVAPDVPGFLVNRMLVPMILEAICLYEIGCAKESIDSSMKLGANHPMGPLELADFVGLDTLLYLADYIYSQTGDSKFLPPNTLRRFVEAGWLGRKTKKGFYVYS